MNALEWILFGGTIAGAVASLAFLIWLARQVHPLLAGVFVIASAGILTMLAMLTFTVHASAQATSGEAVGVVLVKPVTTRLPASWVASWAIAANTVGLTAGLAPEPWGWMDGM